MTSQPHFLALRACRPVMVLLACGLFVSSTYGEEGTPTFKPGAVVKEFGLIADVQSDMEFPADTVLKVCFDTHQRAHENKINQTINSAARLINMHVAAGEKEESLEIAIVLHGGAIMDVTTQAFFAERHGGKKQASADAVRILSQHRVKFYICGQSAAAQKVTKKDLLPGVVVAPSAMTAHAILAKQGFSLNPF